MIIAISGKLQSGKNTTARIINQLTNNKYQEKAFAGKLKQIVSILTGISVEDLEKQEVKDRYLTDEWLNVNYKVSKVDESTNFKNKSTYRELLQVVGTEAMRNVIHPNCWLNALFVDYVEGDIEIWKDIKNYEGRYQISNFGRVKGLNRKVVYGDESKGQYHTKKEAILKSTITGYYEMIKLEGNNSVTIHSLVADAFLPLIEGKDYINHIDQNPLNNFYKNLERCTQSENIISANKNGNGNIGEKQADSKLTEEDILQIKELLKTTISQKEIAKMYKVGTTTICDIKKGRKWKHIGVKKEVIEPILPVKGSNWLITDMRFPNELQAVKDRGGIIIRINRPIKNYPENPKFNGDMQSAVKIAQNHPSETALDSAEFDYVIDNNSTIEELIEKVKQILIKEKII